MNKKSDKEVEENWNGHWKEILENSDGSINKEQLKLELMDFSDMINRMTSLTCAVTNSRMSYPTYDVKAILQVKEEIEEEQKEEQKLEDHEDGVCSLCEREF